MLQMTISASPDQKNVSATLSDWKRWQMRSWKLKCCEQTKAERLYGFRLVRLDN